MAGRPELPDDPDSDDLILYEIRLLRWEFDDWRGRITPDLWFARKARLMLADGRAFVSFTLKYLLLPIVVVGLAAAFFAAPVAAGWEDDRASMSLISADFDAAVGDFNAASQTPDAILRADRLHDVQVIVVEALDAIMAIEPEPCAEQWWRLMLTSWTLHEEALLLMTRQHPAGPVISRVAASVHGRATEELERACV